MPSVWPALHPENWPSKLWLGLSSTALLGLGLYSVGTRALIIIALATLVSEDLTAIHVGVLARQGQLGFLRGTLACFAGIFLGDVLLYLAGRFVGRAALSRWPLNWFLSAAAVTQCSQWLQQRGALVILLSRLVPGTRLPNLFCRGRPAHFVQTIRCLFFACQRPVDTVTGGAGRLAGRRFVD